MNSKNELINMDKAIKLLKTSRPTFYRWMKSGKIQGVKVGRQWRFYKEELNRFIKGETPAVPISGDLYSFVTGLEAKLKKQKVKLSAVELENDLDRAVFYILLLATAQSATDIHIAAQLEESKVISVIRFRMHRKLEVIMTFDNKLHQLVVDKLKMMCNCDTRIIDHPQDGRFKTSYSGFQDDRKMVFLISFVPTVIGESVTARVLNQNVESYLISFDRLGFKGKSLELIEKAITAPLGMIVTSGPAGHGKTTTLYGMLNYLKGPQKKIITVENPVEILLPWITQVQVNEKNGDTYEAHLRAALRSDPDVIMLAEMNRENVVKKSLQASIDGALILSQSHGYSCAMVVRNMMEYEKNHIMVADGLKLVTSQRLLRSLCPHCRKRAKLTDETIERIEILLRENGVEDIEIPKESFESVGCEHCHRGYVGRFAVTEVMPITPKIKRVILRNGSEQEIYNEAMAEGMKPLILEALMCLSEGRTTVSELLRNFG